VCRIASLTDVLHRPQLAACLPLALLPCNYVSAHDHIAILTRHTAGFMPQFQALALATCGCASANTASQGEEGAQASLNACRRTGTPCSSSSSGMALPGAASAADLVGPCLEKIIEATPARRKEFVNLRHDAKARLAAARAPSAWLATTCPSPAALRQAHWTSAP